MLTGEQPTTNPRGAAVVGGHFDPKSGPGPPARLAGARVAWARRARRQHRRRTCMV